MKMLFEWHQNSPNSSVRHLYKMQHPPGRHYYDINIMWEEKKHTATNDLQLLTISDCPLEPKKGTKILKKNSYEVVLNTVSDTSQKPMEQRPS